MFHRDGGASTYPGDRQLGIYDVDPALAQAVGKLVGPCAHRRVDPTLAGCAGDIEAAERLAGPDWIARAWAVAEAFVETHWPAITETAAMVEASTSDEVIVRAARGRA